MRIKNSITNFISGLTLRLTTILLNFVARTIFINILGTSYLGVNGLLMNVLSMLSLAELGIGTAINFSLYKPLADKDDKKIAVLMQFYKRAYQIIGVVVFLVGLILMLFLDVIIKDPGEVENLKLIFFIYLINTSYSYFMTYKGTLITADQRGYLLTKANVVFNVVTIVSQVLVLIVTRNYIAYLLANMVCLFIQRLYINRKVTELYPVLKEKSTEKLPKEELSVIIKNVKAMVFHKIGDYCINGTDNIIISTFISVTMVGVYSNYLMIISMVNGIIVMFFNSLTASMGNLIATENKGRKLEVFEIINFIAFWLFGFATVAFYNLLNPFIEIWLGAEFLLPQSILVVILINYYLTGMRVPVHTVKAAAGLYDEDKYTPIIQSIVNLGLSIILVQKLGLVGVFIGTLVSSLILPCWQRPYIVYKYVFKKSIKQYFTKYLSYLTVILLNTFGIEYFFNLHLKDYTIGNFILKVVIIAIIPNLIILLIFFKTTEFKEILSIGRKFLKRG